MGNRLSKIVTKTGDDGSTGLADGSRTSKDAVRIEAMGDVDELNSLIGWLAVAELPPAIAAQLGIVQHRLFDVGGALSMPQGYPFPEQASDDLETVIEELNNELPALKEFILPGGNEAAARCHLARAVCRRAERRLVALNKRAVLPQGLLAYVNRLSDYLFVLARSLNRVDGQSEVFWQKGL